MAEEKEISQLTIFLEGGEEVILLYPSDNFEDVYERLQNAIKSGDCFQIDEDNGEEMWFGENFLTDLNSKKIVGLNYLS
ncbi:MAG: hypothetical protein J7L39_03205 [Candidatus Aenigmarchaeota archaeon]|nr:hypothetical protein [Candidatus Aenigmarchaeota archaeon]